MKSLRARTMYACRNSGRIQTRRAESVNRLIPCQKKGMDSAP